jgi:hypothetical protein
MTNVSKRAAKIAIGAALAGSSPITLALLGLTQEPLMPNWASYIFLAVAVFFAGIAFRTR